MSAAPSMTVETGPFSGLARWWRNLKVRRAAMDELDRCGGEEVAHIARDIGLGSSELCDIAAKGPDDRNLLGQRLVASGLSREALMHDDPRVMRDLERACAHCTDRTQCSHDLASHPADPGWRDYCPNVTTIEMLRSVDRDDRRARRRQNWRSF